MKKKVILCLTLSVIFVLSCTKKEYTSEVSKTDNIVEPEKVFTMSVNESTTDTTQVNKLTTNGISEIIATADKVHKGHPTVTTLPSKVEYESPIVNGQIQPGLTFGFHFFRMTFKEHNTFIIDYYDENPETYTYSLSENAGLTFITVESPETASSHDFGLVFPEKTYLLLCSTEYIAFYGKGDKCYAENYTSASTMTEISYINSDNIFSVNHLVENGIEYSAKNVGNWYLDEVWAIPKSLDASLVYDSLSSARKRYSGDALKKYETSFFSEQTDIDFAKSAETTEEYLIWTSGFVNRDNIELYSENARPKKITISVLNPRTNTQTDYVFELLDTPNPQVLSCDGLPFFTYADHIITITVQEVYPGTKYSDVCVSSIRKYFGRKE